MCRDTFGHMCGIGEGAPLVEEALLGAECGSPSNARGPGAGPIVARDWDMCPRAKHAAFRNHLPRQAQRSGPATAGGDTA